MRNGEDAVRQQAEDREELGCVGTRPLTRWVGTRPLTRWVGARPHTQLGSGVDLVRLVAGSAQVSLDSPPHGTDGLA